VCFDDIAQQVQCMRICNVSVIFVGLPSKCVIGIISSIVGYELSYFTQWGRKRNFIRQYKTLYRSGLRICNRL